MSNVATPNTDDTPTSCHKKYVTTTVSIGPTHRKGTYKSDMSNRFTSLDIRFIILPAEV